MEWVWLMLAAFAFEPWLFYSMMKKVKEDKSARTECWILTVLAVIIWQGLVSLRFG